MTSSRAPRLLAAAAAGLLSAATAGCASGGSEIARTQAMWERAVARRGVDPSLVPFPMEQTPAIRSLAHSLAGPGTDKQRLERIQEALFDKETWAFEYAAEGTFTSREAFEARRGNCVAFTNLFIAMGRSLGLPLRAALASRRGTSEKEGDLVLVYSHLLAVLPEGSKAAVYDFYSTSLATPGAVRLIDDLDVAAIRASNLGVAAIRQGDLATAQEHLEIAVRLGPTLGAVHANLGLVHWRLGGDDAALAAFLRGLEAEPRSSSLLQNLAAYYVEKGRPAEARAALAAARPDRATVYLLLVRGNLLLASGDVKGALSSFKQARKAAPEMADPHLAIARTEQMRGNLKKARKSLAEAARLSPDSEEVKALTELIGGPGA